MNRNMLYLLVTLLAVVVAAILLAPRKEPVQATALPSNGLVETPQSPAARAAIARPAVPAATKTSALPAPAPAGNLPLPPNVPANPDADDVPQGAEVSGEGAPAQPATQQPAPVPVTPSEGQ